MSCTILIVRLSFLAFLILGIGPPIAVAQEAETKVLVADAILAYDNQRYEEALTYLDRALQLRPNFVRALYYQGLVFLNLKKAESAIGPLQKANELRPSDINIRYQLGVAHLSAEHYSQANHFFEELYQEEADFAFLPFYVGYLRFYQNDYSDALAAFEAVQSDNPDLLPLVSFYKGMCLGVLGLSEQAIVELEQVQSTDSAVLLTSSAMRIRNALSARRPSQKPFRASLTVGVGYDDNVAVNPDRSSNAAAEELRTRKTPSATLLASALADYSFYRNGPLEGTIRYSFFQTLNLNHGLSVFNFQNHLVGLGGYYRGSLAQTISYQLGVNYSYDYSFLDQDAFLARHLINFSPMVIWPTATLPVLGPVGNLTVPLVRYQIQSFFREIGDHTPGFQSERRDSFTTTLGGLHLFRLLDDQLIFRVGYQYDNENTQGSAFSYRGDRFLTGFQVTLPWGDVTLQYDYDIHWRDYKNSQTNFLDEDGRLSSRSDRQHSHLVQLVKPLWWNLSWTFQYQGIRNQSNIPVFDFSKNVFTTFLTWNY